MSKEKPTLQDALDISEADRQKAIDFLEKMRRELPTDPEDRILYVNTLIDQIMQIQIETGPDKPSCHKGCSFCCSIQVNMTPLEAENILRYVRDNDIAIDKQKLERQARITDQFEWPLSPDKQCVFLKEGLCSIYPVRPITCRMHFVMGDPKTQCDTDNNPNGTQATLFNMTAMLVAIAAWDERDEGTSSTLPKQLLKILNK